MSSTLPSNVITDINIPELKLKTKFVYNFYDKDESTNEISGIKAKFLEKKTVESDSTYYQYAVRSLPRYVRLEWNIPNNVEVKDTNQYQNIIRDNLERVITQEQFSSNGYVSLAVQDQNANVKMFDILSGSLALARLDDSVSKDASPFSNMISLGRHLDNIGTSKKTKQVLDALTQLNIMNGIDFRSSNGAVITKNPLDDIKNGIVDIQINSKFAYDMLNKATLDPLTTTGQSYINCLESAKNIQQSTLKDVDNIFSYDIPLTPIQVASAISSGVQKPVVVGYIINKFEIVGDKFKLHPPIIIDNPRTNNCLDPRVKLLANYAYTIQMVIATTIPDIDMSTGKANNVLYLIASKQSSLSNVNCLDDQAPPHPTNLKFVWEYSSINPYNKKSGRLMIYWAFPVNLQRDIKYFQVFRRSNIDEPFELIKQYNFNDSSLQPQLKEIADSSLVEELSNNNIKTLFYDDEFYKNSKYIYSIVAIDARGNSSTYSEQYEITFDKLKNKLMLKQISISGAPKMYPNLYLNEDLFIDSAKISDYKKFKIYFTPEHYTVKKSSIDGTQLFSNVITTKQESGYYAIQFINSDNQKSQLLKIELDKRTKD